LRKPALKTGKPAARKAPVRRPAAVKPKPKPRQDKARQLAGQIVQLALSKKAFDISVMDLKDLSGVADYFVLASGATDIQVRAICKAIDDGLRAKGIRPHHVEGMANATWVLLDYVDVVAHVMQPRVRDYYGIEELWADAPKEEVKE
jgi:ribosome-associated protein